MNASRELQIHYGVRFELDRPSAHRLDEALRFVAEYGDPHRMPGMVGDSGWSPGYETEADLRKMRGFSASFPMAPEGSEDTPVGRLAMAVVEAMRDNAEFDPDYEIQRLEWQVDKASLPQAGFNLSTHDRLCGSVALAVAVIQVAQEHLGAGPTGFRYYLIDPLGIEDGAVFKRPGEAPEHTDLSAWLHARRKEAWAELTPATGPDQDPAP